MQKYFDYVIDQNGHPVFNANITVYDEGTTDLATIYSDNGVTESDNPVTSDSTGYFEFYAADGRYDVNIGGTGITTQTIEDVLMEDPADGILTVLLGGTGASTAAGARTNLGVTSTADLALSSGSSLVGHIASGTGASAVTVQSKLRTMVTDGDYSTAQQAATAALNKVFFVPAASTVTVTVPTDVATFALALTAIARWVIPNDSLVQIIVPTASLSSPTVINHPYGSRVEILGSSSTVTLTATTLASAVSGSSGAWSVQMNVDTTTGVSIGNYAIVRSVSGTGQYLLFEGMFPITAVGVGTITVTNPAQNAAWPTAALSGATITVVRTVITYSGCDGLQIDGPLGSIDKIAIVGDRTSGTVGLIASRAETGLKGTGRVKLGSSFGVWGFGDAGILAMLNGVIDGRYVVSMNCLLFNIFAQHGGSVMANNVITGGAGQAGLYAHSGGDIWAENGVSCGNALYGAWCLPGGSILMQDGFAWSNVSDGVRMSWGGEIRAPSISAKFNGGQGVFAHDGGVAVVTSGTFSNNSGSGVYVQGGGVIDATSGTMSSNTQYGVYNDGGFIDSGTATASSNGINGITATNGGIILADQVTGSGNGTYLISANNGARIRATNASASGQSIFAANGALIDATGITGSPTMTYGSGGMIMNAAGTLGWGAMTLTSGSIDNMPIGATTPSTALFTSVRINGATATTVFNVAKDSSYNSEASAAFCAQNITDPLKMVVWGYDNTRDYGFIQALKSTSGYKNLAINPNAGNVGIGLGATDPTGRLHLPAGAAGANNAPLKLTSGTNLTTAEAGALEYNGTNLFFTRSGTTREGVLTESAVTTEALVSDTSVTVNIGGTTYKLLARA